MYQPKKHEVDIDSIVALFILFIFIRRKKRQKLYSYISVTNITSPLLSIMLRMINKDVYILKHSHLALLWWKQHENIRNCFPHWGCYVQIGMKNHDFRPISRFISETIQDMAELTMEDDSNLSNSTISNDCE